MKVNLCASENFCSYHLRYHEFVFLLSFLILFFLLGAFSHYSLPLLCCVKDFLAYLRIVSEYFVQVLFG